MYKKLLVTLAFIAALFIPTQVLAVDFSITNVNIDAHLQDDGHVFVQETHTYEFKGEFGGIIRVLIPKEETKIVQLEAFEDGQQLMIETDGFKHRIHRAGNDETITVDIFYKIEDGVDVYSDLGEFFWAFFDKNNESTYENLTITVIPPESTSDVIAFGYHEAFEKESIRRDGSVIFNFGLLPKKRNGDIRVAYDAKLFEAAPVGSTKEMRDELTRENQQLIDAAIARADRKQLLSNLGKVILPIFGFMLLMLVVRSVVRSTNKKAVVKREIENNVLIPKQTLSMPTTIFFTNFQQITSETMAAALLDLVRKGHVENVEDKHFHLINRNDLLKHEAILVEWLFDEIGENGEFNFDDLVAYTEDEKNHEAYQSYQTKWHKAIRDEMRAAGLYEKNDKFRRGIGFSSMTILVPFLILFPIYGLMVEFFFTFLLVAMFFTVAIIVEKTFEGEKISYEWRKFKRSFKDIASESWQALTEDEKMRAFIYGLGINEKSIQKKNETLITSFKLKSKNTSNVSVYSIDPSWLIISAAAASSFQSADTTIGGSDSGISTSAGVGGGVSGGGGGSGAF